MATDLWTQALLLQYDPLARIVRDAVAQIFVDADAAPKTMRALVGRFSAAIPSAPAKTCVHGTMTFVHVVGGDRSETKSPPPKRSWADVARLSATSRPTNERTVARYHFPSQAHWAAFRLYAYEWYRPLVDVADGDVSFVERQHWGDLSDDSAHQARIRARVASSLEIVLVERARPMSSDSESEDHMTSSADLEDLRGGIPPLWAMTPSPTASPASSPSPPGHAVPASRFRSWADMCDDQF